MPKYSYAPLSTDPEAPHPKSTKREDGDNFSKKRDMMVGFLVLAAVVYVLARAGGGADCDISTATISSIAHPSTSSTDDFDIGAYRQKILSQSVPHIIECAEAGEGGSQEACHLPRKTRYAALNQKGVTLWMTGLSGSGKSTIASLLEDDLVKKHGKAVYRLDGDNVRTGLNRDLGFSQADRAESVRRVGEMACLFADAGMITIVSLISPYRGDRDEVRKRHKDQGINFLEVFMDVPLTVVQDRDPKGLYKKVAEGKIKGFTGVDDPYEAPEHAELVIKNHELTVRQSVDIILQALKQRGYLVGGPTLQNGLPYPDGDEILDLMTPKALVHQRRIDAESLPKALLTDIDLNWLQTLGEGWAAPLKGFMREGALLQTLHFNSILVDPFNLTGSKGVNSMRTDFENFDKKPPKRVSMSMPIVLPCTCYTKHQIERSGKKEVALMTKFGHTVAILHNPEIYVHRKEEIVSRMFGVIDFKHPYIEHIYSSGKWLIGGEIELLERIQYNDGLDQWRLTASEVMAQFESKEADAVFAFQTRNPTHAGHAYLMKTSRDMLLKRGYKNPILWLSPLGGWTKGDDVPLDVRVKQHEAVLSEGMLDPTTTVMAIWPAPMVYGGPTEVLFHAKSRRNAGASYFVAGRDPAGMKGSDEAYSHPEDDLYDGNHGRYVLANSPGQDPMEIIPFTKVYYDKRDHVMKDMEASRPDDFISISGSKMRALARAGATPCDVSEGRAIPSDLLAANCVPPGFMVETGWNIVCDYYQNVDSDRWVPYSVQNVNPILAKDTEAEGKFGSLSFTLYIRDSNKKIISPWHDINLISSGSLVEPDPDTLLHFVVEIPMYTTAKMEMTKEKVGNPIMQDVKDNKPRYYTYGIPLFNYGFLPQTWESKIHMDPTLNIPGDNDPIDVIEVGGTALMMGAVVTVKVLGSIALIDEGEIDHKIIALRSDHPHFHDILSMSDLEKYQPGVSENLLDWFVNYKTSDGKEKNKLKQDTITSSTEALRIVHQVNGFYKTLLSTKEGGEEFSLPLQ
mmetsp:Transcript_12536/g.12623  ORF Transcript_12536/g.12623 Transcript_12536/m.12623 type:complete len:1022 (-) Transcript_12536:127-3192(-)